MIDERAARRPEFVEGRRVYLSDHNCWSLPIRDPAVIDPEYDALLIAVSQAEDRNGALFAELGLTIHLLTRNYQLRPSDLDELLRFGPDDDALSVLQRDVHLLVLASFGGFDRQPECSGVEPSKPPGVSRGWSFGWLGFRRAVHSRVLTPTQTPVT